jgi:RND family efflux transporter MFP subunit
MSGQVKIAAAMFVLAAALLGAGCEGTATAEKEAKPIKIDVSEPVARTITDYEVFSGRTDALESTDVRARVSGYLEQIKFADGAHVKAGDVLFEIDPRPYQAALLQARATSAKARADVVQMEAAVARDESNLAYLASEFNRNRQLNLRRAVSDSDFDKSRGDLGASQAVVKVSEANAEAAKAAVKAADAAEKIAELSYEFTKVRAPITGVISRRWVDRGNMVTADQTILTNIVRLDKVYAYFDVDERTWLDLRRRLLGEGQLNAMENSEIPVWIGLANDSGYPFEGRIDFADNKLDPSTGTMRLRGTFDNRNQYLQPGMFVRVMLPVGKPHEALLVADQAIGSDQGRQFVFVVNENNEIVYRRVETGALHNGLREIKSVRKDDDSVAKDSTSIEGLRKGERIIVNGLQRVRQGVTVEPNKVPMPNPKEAIRTPTVATKPGAMAEGKSKSESAQGGK